MLRIDFYVQHLLRHNADGVELASDRPVKFLFPSGERQSKQNIDHAQISQLVREAAPPRAMNELESMGRTRFQHQSQGLEVTVAVTVESPAVWVVRVSPGSASAPAVDDGIGIGIEVGGGAAMEEGLIERHGYDAGPAAASPMASARNVQAAAAPMAAAPMAAASMAGAPMAAPRAAAPRVSASGEPGINRYLRQMVAAGASDLHVSSNVPPMWRLHGEMQAFEVRAPFAPEELHQLLWEIIPERNRTEFEAVWDTDFAHTIEGVSRFRANVFMDRHGIGGVFRQIPFEILGWEKLGLPKSVIDLCWLTKGLVVVTGPTGSGKSTTLAALIDFINDSRSDHIITIEDPVEFVHPNKRCLVNQREVGTHTKSFKAALRAALREDPDIVLVGEMRDLETIAIAIETAETGHLVFGTLHTTSAKSTVDRIIDQFPADRQEQIRVMLAESLRGVIAQVLCKKKGGGRVAAYEIMVSNHAVANLIREGKTFQLTSVLQTGKNLGMQTLNDHLFSLVHTGVVEPEEAYMKSNDKSGLKDSFAKSNIKLKI